MVLASCEMQTALSRNFELVSPNPKTITITLCAFPSIDATYTDYQASPSWGCPRGVMVKAMNCGIVVREFVLQSRYYVHFRANTLGKV